jgi:C-terminal region of Mon2 protein
LVSSSGPFGNTLSKYCLNNLFELCRFQPYAQNLFTEEEESPGTQDKRIHEIKKKIAQTTTPVLINRCRDTLKKYASDEQKSGNMTLPRQRVSEAVFILEKLRQLDCYPEVHASSLPQGNIP